MKLKSYYKKNPLIAVGTICLLVLLIFSGWIKKLDTSLFDTWTVLRGVRETGKEIVIVAVDDPSIQSINQKWPWSREVFGDLLDKLISLGAKAVALDFLFTEPGTEKEDRYFQAVLDSHGKSVPVVSALNLYQEVTRQAQEGEETLFMVQKKAELPVFRGLYSGFINISPDGDGVVRRTLLDRSFEGTLYHALAFEIYRLLGKENFGNWYSRYPDLNRKYFLNFVGPDKSFPRISAFTVLQEEEKKPSFDYKDKIFLIGPVFNAGKDYHSTPIDYFSGLYRQMAGVEIHATILENLLHENFYLALPYFYEGTLWVLLCTVIFLFFQQFGWMGKKLWLTLIGVWILVFLTSFSLFVSFKIYARVVYPLFSSVFLAIALFWTKKLTTAQGLKIEMGQLGAHNIEWMDIFCQRYEITKREKELLPLLAKQLSNPEIAGKLFVSINTVKTHVASIYKKTGVNSREELSALLSSLIKK